MARRRKNEAKTTVKPTAKYVAVRKSSRQMAKKQLEDKRVNGSIVERTDDVQGQASGKKTSNSQRKNGKHKVASAGEGRSTVFDEIDGYKRETADSDSQDGSEVVLDSEKLSPEDVRQVVGVGTGNDAEETASNDVEMWPEQIIEETIICEEMEVEGDQVPQEFTITEDGDVMMKQVLVVEDSNLQGKDLVRFEVIRNDDGTESMVMSSVGESTKFQVIEETESRLLLDEPETAISALYTDESQESSNEGNSSSGNYDKVKNKKVELVEEDRTNSSECFQVAEDCAVVKSSERTSKELDKELATMRISDNCKEIEKLVKDLSSTESVDSPIQSFPSTSEEKVSLVSQDDESSSSILDKMEQLHRSSNSERTNVSPVDDFPGNFSPIGEKSDSNETAGRSKGPEERKDRKNVNHANFTENEGEDVKSSCSSENSSDTLLSVNSCKVQENEAKTIPGSNEAEKKTEFRNRSGSTDTTGSESGSNSSGVRRSSRIRSIGLMKQRSKGRGLVVKTATTQLEKSLSNVPQGSQESKINPESQSEGQGEKEAKTTSLTTAQTTATTMTTTTTPVASPAATLGQGSTGTGYDSDSSKPVKVKSRWRRSSELEMGGSASGFCSGGFGFALQGISPVESSSGTKTNGSTDSTSHSNVLGNLENEKYVEPAGNNGSTSSKQVSRTVGAKILLPMVLEVKDREMEERLSQFEHLKENLYLTERYTNKETKRMVCDCFLTEEEIDRGELGCGEDCLNRLLMIECGSRCVVGDRCTNKRFQNCEYAKCEVFRTEKKGFGLRATVDLDAGEFIMEYVGEVVDPKDFRRRAKEYSKDKNRHYYFMALKSDQIIDATMKGNVSRFINHSCDPNAETQKWTVNGELRIGFFNKKFIAAGEEITFDYHFQRYGKEAQKCFCEAPNCRGWIGETPDEEKEKIEKKEKREKDSKKKKEEKKSPDYMEDEDLKEEIDKLSLGGLKNRTHTLTLSRLMVRSRELEHRTRLLKVIQTGEQPCRRLFLDYHGLRLIWSYVMDIANDDSEEAQQFRLEVLKTLQTLPIPNKTMLMDSKIYKVVEKWAKRLYLSPNGDSPEDEQAKAKANGEDLEGTYDQTNELPVKSENVSSETSNDTKQENIEQAMIPSLAASLLGSWANLKEVFRIPKKERIEQMKEHEREADRGYREELEKEERRGNSYDRPRSDRFVRNENDKRGDRRRGRESPDSEYGRAKDKKTEERSSLVPIPRMSKYERRQLFALKVAKEEEERQRRQQQESWQEHEARCLALGMDPHTTAMLDPQTGYPLFFNPALGQWQHYPIQEGGEVAQQCTPVYVGPSHGAPGLMSQTSHLMTPPFSTDMTTAMAPGTSPVVYSLNQASAYNPTATSYPLIGHRHQQYSNDVLNPLNSAINGNQTTTLQLQTQNLYGDKSTEQRLSTANESEQTEIPPIDLPPKWKCARDARGRVYYYHVKERVSQWLPPPPDHIGVQPDSSSTSESSDESSSSNEDDDDVEEDHPEDKEKIEDADMDANVAEINDTKQMAGKKTEQVGFGPTVANVAPQETKKRRDGLVQERIISPRREEDRMDHKRYKEIKDKLRRQKERAKLKEHVEKLRKHRRSNKSKSHSRHGPGKTQSVSNESSNISERKIKDAFRINMANVMVHFLNPYRKNDCKQGRITNTEDFKHLARKLTHFVLAKELKHCKSVDELQCNDNVKHKAKDFVRKYMSKFGAVYQKGTDED